MRIYEIFRKTNETYICLKINLDGKGLYNLKLCNFFIKHMLEQFIINGLINLYILNISDFYIDNHHFIEDLGIIIGRSISNSLINKNNIERYGLSYIPLDESLSRSVIDFCGRSYLKYDLYSYKIYISDFDIDLIYDFFLSLITNSNITLHIINIYGFNIHHKIESIFKAFGNSFRIALNYKIYSNSTKGILF